MQKQNPLVAGMTVGAFANVGDVLGSWIKNAAGIDVENLKRSKQLQKVLIQNCFLVSN